MSIAWEDNLLLVIQHIPYVCGNWHTSNKLTNDIFPIDSLVSYGVVVLSYNRSIAYYTSIMLISYGCNMALSYIFYYLHTRR